MKHENPPNIDARELVAHLLHLRQRMVEASTRLAGAIATVPEEWRASARNLVHYVELRQFDMRDTQRALAVLGLSSLGRNEAHVLAGLDAVLKALARITDVALDLPSTDSAPSFDEGAVSLARHTAALLGAARPRRTARIMVTMPSEAATDYALVRELVARGMDCMRINAAHDSPPQWRSMAAHARRAAAELGRECKVQIDLPGPKLRTGPLPLGPRALKWRPSRDERGRVVRPARIALASAAGATTIPVADVVLRLPRRFVESLEPGARVRFVDVRGKRRELAIVEAADGVRFGEAHATAYVAPETALESADGSRALLGDAVPPLDRPLRLRVGDELVVTADGAPAAAATHDATGNVLEPARIACTLPTALADVRTGHAIWFDDGKIGGVVVSAAADALRVRITQAKPEGSSLLADKGINLPDTTLHLPALAEDDKAALAVAFEHADLVALSFARSAEDVAELQAELARSPRPLGIVLKIETRAGFECLPRILLAAMRTPPVGVMIARGDLAIECGFERLAEVQEELLWICEAAHVPVVWATQVLEGLAKHGVPSRAEITDAAMGVRAECVMLNKGPFVGDALSVLASILERMQGHQSKKTSMMRRLRSPAFE